MVLAIGIVVDDAIVVVENVERIMSEEGLSPRDATRKAMDQIVNAIIAITLVLSAVFVPMAFFGGSVGAIYRQFAVTLVLTMLFSALMALTLTPALCATLLKHEPGEEMLPIDGLLRLVQPLLRRTTRGYTSWVAPRARQDRALRWCSTRSSSPPPAGCSRACPAASCRKKTRATSSAWCSCRRGPRSERTLEVLSQVEQYYLKQPEVEHVIGVVGFSFFGRGQNAAIAFVRLKDWDERPGEESGANALVQRANMTFFRIKQAMIFAINRAADSRTGGGRRLRLPPAGPRRPGPRKAAGGAQHGARHGRPGSSVWSACARKARRPAPQLFLDIDRVKARALGVDHRRPQRDPAIDAGRRLHQRLRAPGPHPARADAGRGRYAHARRRHPARCRSGTTSGDMVPLSGTGHGRAGSSVRPSSTATTACRR